MGHYRVLLRCELPDGFTIESEAIAGFYATRFVDALFDIAAGNAAIEALKSEDKFRRLRAQLAADPIIVAAEIEMTSTPSPSNPLTGYAFYRRSEDSGDAA